VNGRDHKLVAERGAGKTQGTNNKGRKKNGQSHSKENVKKGRGAKNLNKRKTTRIKNQGMGNRFKTHAQAAP